MFRCKKLFFLFFFSLCFNSVFAVNASLVNTYDLSSQLDSSVEIVGIARNFTTGFVFSDNFADRLWTTNLSVENSENKDLPLNLATPHKLADNGSVVWASDLGVTVFRLNESLQDAFDNFTINFPINPGGLGMNDSHFFYAQKSVNRIYIYDKDGVNVENFTCSVFSDCDSIVDIVTLDGEVLYLLEGNIFGGRIITLLRNGSTVSSRDLPFLDTGLEDEDSITTFDGERFYVVESAEDKFFEILYDNVSLASPTIINPTADEVISFAVDIPLNFSVSNAPDACWYTVDGGDDVALPNCTNVTFSTVEGGHTLFVYANNSIGNIASDSVDFTVALTAPVVSLVLPLDGSFNGSSVVDVKFTAVDPNGLDGCDLYGNFSGVWLLNESFSGVSNGSQVSSSKDLLDGVYVWNVFCNDSTGAANFSVGNFSFVVDTVSPVISGVDVSSVEGSQTVSFNVSDFSELHCNETYFSVFDGDGVNNGLENVSSDCVEFNGSFTVSAFGSYNLSVYVVDKAGNLGFNSFSFVTQQIQQGTGGGGGGGAPVVLTCNQSGNVWEVTTEFGRKAYNFAIPYENAVVVEKSILIRNFGSEVLDVGLGCLKTDDAVLDICDFVNFSNSSVVVAPNLLEPRAVVMGVAYPVGADNGDEFSFSVDVSDGVCSFSLSNRAFISRLSFGKYRSVDLSVLRSDWVDFVYPAVVPAVVAWVFLIFVGFLLSRRLRSSFVGIFLVGVVGGAAAFFLLIYV